ncbi:MAG: C39 family peptidase [Candidatus Woesearchaeota archaeon]
MNQKPPYKSITQLPHCCCPTCLTMILDRRKINHGTQEEIGNQLGLIVSPKNAHLFKNAIVKDDPNNEYGTQTNKDEYSINKFFSKNNMKLKEIYFQIEEVENPKEFIIDNLKKGNDIMVCINNKILYGEGHGHLSLIQSIKNNEVTLIDPGIDKPKIRVVELDKLTESMKIEYHQKRKRGGFWIIAAI